MPKRLSAVVREGDMRGAFGPRRAEADRPGKNPISWSLK
jgi:hypothetical protein